MNILLSLLEETDIEDLPLKDFLKQLEDLSNFTISSQANAAQLFFGLDKDGVFYTSQWSANNPEKFFYKVSDYPNVVESNLFKTAHLALSKRLDIIDDFLEPGQAVDCRVAFKSNEEFSEHNVISIVRGIAGQISSPKNINKLTDELKDHQVQVRSKQLDTIDGSQLFTTTILSKWIFQKTEEISGDELNSKDLSKSIEKLKVFLKLPNKIALKLELQMTNFEVAVVNLTQIEMKLRSKLKGERERLNQEILVKFKLPIKDELLVGLEDKLNSKSAVIHRNDKAVQITDSDSVDSVNDFNSIVKRQLYGMIRTNDPSATIEERGGLINVANQRIANLFGTPELTNFMSARKIFSDLKGSTLKETAQNFATNLENQDLYGVKGKINAILKYTLKELALKLVDFTQNSTDYKLILAGKELRYSPKVIKQTLLDFAEVKHQLEDLLINIGKAKNFTDIILIMYNNVIEAAHKFELKEQINEHNLKDLAHLTSDDICKAYTANLIATQLLLRTQDKYALALIKDPAHSDLKKYTPGISPLNYWGLALFGYKNTIKEKLSNGTNSELHKISGRIINPRIRKIHHTLSMMGFSQDWALQEENARLIIMRLSTREQSLNLIITGIRYWDDIMLSDRVTVINKMFYYMQLHAPLSPLFPRIKALANSILTTSTSEKNTDKMNILDLAENFLLDLSTLSEEEMGATTAANAGTSGNSGLADMGGNDPSTTGATTLPKDNRATKAGDIANVPKKLFKGKQIIRRKKDFVKKKKFAKTFEGLESLSSLKQIDLSWNDSDFKGDPQADAGFKYIKKEYGINPVLKESRGPDGFPLVRLIGSEVSLRNFTILEYNETSEFFKTNIKDFSGDL